MDPLQAVTQSKGNSLSRKIYLQMKSSIFSGTYAQGDELNENEIAKQLRISKTPVRLAVRDLYKDGLVIMRPRKSSLVRQFTREDLAQTLPFVMNLEEFALRRLSVEGDEQDLRSLVKRSIRTKEDLFEAKQELFGCTGNIKMIVCWIYSSGPVRVMLNRIIKILDMESQASKYRDIVSSLLEHDGEGAIMTMKTAYAEMERKLLLHY